MARDELPLPVILRAQRGDQSAFRQVVERYQAGVFKLALKMTSNHTEAADLTQEAFLRVYRFFHKFDPSRPLAPWLYRLATNLVLNHVKARRPASVSLDSETSVARGDLAAPGPDASDAVVLHETAERVRDAVGELRPNLRAAVTLYYLRELSLKEVAEALSVPEATAKVWLFRGRQALKEKLENTVS